MIKIKNNFDLDATITCGQIFRYKKENDSYIVILKDRVISLKKENDYIMVESNNEENLYEIICDYFDLNRDYKKINKEILLNNNDLKELIKFNNGLKIIQQYPFETIISYIISQNNRVTSISNSLDMLSKKYGEKIDYKDSTYYLFPSEGKLLNLTIDDYKECKVGFRAKYLYNIMNCMKNKSLDINSIYNMDGDTALKYLMEFPGIGPKVASCILLFAYQKLDVYPIDTWVKKYMKDYYDIEGEKNIREYTKNNYLNYSGIIIQYMFNYRRNKK